MVVFVSNCLIWSGFLPLLFSIFIMATDVKSVGNGSPADLKDSGNFNPSAGVLSAGASLVNGVLGLAGQKLASKYQMQNWQKQFDLINAYNHPKQQLERLYDAGINPLYNSDFSGNSVASISSSSPELGVPNLGLVENYERARESMFNRSQEELQTEYLRWKIENEKEQSKEHGANAAAIPIRTAAEFQESMAHTETLLSEKDLNDEKRNEVKANIERMQAFTRIQENELRLKFWQYKLEKRKFEYHKESNDYSLATDRMNATANQMSARTNRLQFEFDKNERFPWQKKLDSAKYKLEDDIQRAMLRNKEEELRQKAKQLSNDEFRQFVEHATTYGPFGVKFWSTESLDNVWRVYEAMGNVLESGDLSEVKRIDLLKARENIASQLGYELGRNAAEATKRFLKNLPSHGNTDYGRGIFKKQDWSNYKPTTWKQFWHMGQE